MYITISDHETIGAIRKKFSARFPFLRIDLFRAVATDVPDSALRIADEETALGAIRSQHNTGKIGIEASMTTKALEDKFLKEFGLYMQIFRRSGSKWLITTSTDNYTLDRQNALGMEMSEGIAADEPIDIHEQE